LADQPDIPEEYPIADIPATKGWSENFALLCGNTATRSGVFFSIGRWHADPTMWRENLTIVLPDGRAIFSKSYGRNGTRNAPCASNARYEVLEPGRRVRLVFDGPVWQSTLEELVRYGFRDDSTKRCQADLSFESTVPVWNMKGDSIEAATMAGSMHIDQIGAVNGTIQYDGETHRYTNAYAIRDHSRGVRDVSKFGRSCWISGTFPGGRAFYLYVMSTFGATTAGMQNATVVQDGKFHPAKVAHTQFIDGPEHIGRLHEVTLTSALGEMKIEITEVFVSFATSMVPPFDTGPGAIRHRNAALIIDESVRMRWDGKDGFGWSERGFTERPLEL
jgi:hypothetical protein